MTQKILFVVSGLLIIGAIIAIIVSNKPKVSAKILTVETEYNYVYTDTKKITIKIFSNKIKHKVHFIDNINYVFLENNDQTNRFELDLEEISYSHEEKYIGDDYYCYNYHFKMPRLESNLLLEDAKLHITMINGDNYSLSIGSFQFLYYPEVGLEKVVKILGEYGYKQEGSEFSRLNKIILEVESLKNVTIESITIDSQVNLDFEIKDSEIIILIPFKRIALFQAPIIINLTKDGISTTQVVDNFLFFNDYHTLETSSDLCNLYEIDHTN